MTLALAACETTPASTNAAPTITAESRAAESERLFVWFEDVFEEGVSRSPLYQTQLGRKTDNDKWDQATDEQAAADLAWQLAKLEELRTSFDLDQLDVAGKLNYRLYEFGVQQAERSFAFRENGYVFTQRGGAHANIPPFLINFHRVESIEDAEAYITRLETFDTYLDQNREEFEERAGKGVLPPKWAFPQMLRTARNVISGAPFDGGDPSALMADFSAKIDKLDIDEAAKSNLNARAARALSTEVKPAYERLIETFRQLEKQATNDDGVWKLPDGEGYYNARIAASTTTDLTADEIHAIGLRELERLHGDMRSIMAQVGFDGTLQEFFAFLRTDPQFYYPNTDEGRQQYLDRATDVIDDMKARLDTLFITKPKADLIVKRVEPFREQAAGIAFYNRPAEDGSRPGIYYVNLYDMATMPIFQLEAIAYHEGAPGHHMQIAIGQELDGVPRFRRFGGYGAYIEGWGLYSEELPKEIGLYQDPYQDFGRLGLEAWRAVRLIVDTGLHYKKWTREEAIDFMVNNAPLSEEQARKETERYVVTPGQATSYMIGKLKIMELRARATQELGEDFDLREFHEVILANGAVPLTILDELVTAWIAEKKG
ncbi:DUF885 family protein [Parvularcula sp. IMCC14364]|uniref:DUF885 domain-containing protein n=1 Tax=Parvularcula sp. IMCC14364 TaxID=3067902 RepID=UPI003556A052